MEKRVKKMWLDWKQIDLGAELQQLIEEGRDTTAVKHRFSQLLSTDWELDAEGYPVDERFQIRADFLLDRCRDLPPAYIYNYVEPSDWEGIQQEKKGWSGVLPVTVLSEAERQDRIHAAWLARCAGCLHGKPLEGTLRPRLLKFMHDVGLEGKELTDYVWLLPGLTEENCAGFNAWQGASPLHYNGMSEFPGDDDTNYTVLAMAMFEKYGPNFTPANVAEFWLANMPHMATCTAERTAYREFLKGVMPPESALVRNPYREWIGARIRIDFYGYVALGRPELAAEMAWRDASISHVKNGIYGAMWVAVMIAMAPFETDMRLLIEIGLSQIPAQSREFEAITYILERHKAGATYDEMVEYIHQHWDENNCQHWCHTISNDQIVAIGLLYGDGDFEKTITRTVQTCFDADCNGATVGSIIGMMLGTKGIPEKWTGLMNDTIHTGIAGYELTKISALAEEMFLLHLAFEKFLKS